MKKCDYCGREYADEATACTIDRQPLTSITAPPENKTKSAMRQWFAATRMNSDVQPEPPPIVGVGQSDRAATLSQTAPWERALKRAESAFGFGFLVGVASAYRAQTEFSPFGRMIFAGCFGLFIELACAAATYLIAGFSSVAKGEPKLAQRNERRSAPSNVKGRQTPLNGDDLKAVAEVGDAAAQTRRMNLIQMQLLVVGAAVMLLMGLFPPWTKVAHNIGYARYGSPPQTEAELPAGYSFLFDPPKPEWSFDAFGKYYEGGVKIDLGRLLIQWVTIAFVLGAAFLYFKDSDKKSLAEWWSAVTASSRDALPRCIAENRVNGQTLARAEGAQEWKPLSSFPEFTADFKPKPSSPTPEAPLGNLRDPIKPPEAPPISETQTSTLEPPRNPAEPRSPRIVLADDEDWFTEMVELVILHTFRNATVHTYHNRDDAWQELLQADPDLLITDMRNDNVPGRTGYFGMSGWEMLPLLAGRRAKYPILVVSGSADEKGVRKCAGPNLNITFLQKPFTVEQLQEELAKHLDPGGDLH